VGNWHCHEPSRQGPAAGLPRGPDTLQVGRLAAICMSICCSYCISTTPHQHSVCLCDGWSDYTNLHCQGDLQLQHVGFCLSRTNVTCTPFLPACSGLCCRSLLTDEYLRVKGSDGSIWAFGDAATIDQPRALQRADELFEQADVNKVGRPGLVNVAPRHLGCYQWHTDHAVA